LGRKIVIVTYDQARFTLDADIRRCWAIKGSKPIVYKNGSKRAINVGGAYTSTGEFYYHRMKWQTKEEVLWNIKLLRMKFPKMFLLLDKAPWHKNKMVMGYLERKSIPYMFFPTGASDLDPTEFCWKETRENVTANKSHNSEEELYRSLESYWSKKSFKHNLLNYL
jgi:putative transposase